MRRKLTTLRSKQGASQNGAPRQLIDEAIYRELQQVRSFIASGNIGLSVYDTEYSGWSNASRPRDQAISLRSRISIIDPATLPLSGWWRSDDYNPVTKTWIGRASAGASGGRNIVTDAGFAAPTNGIILNGHQTVQFTPDTPCTELGSSASGVTAETFLPAAGATAIVLLNSISRGPNPSPGFEIADNTIFQDDQAVMGLSNSATGFTGAIFNGPPANVYKVSPPQPFANGVWRTCQTKWDGTTLFGRLGLAPFATTPSGPPDYANFPPPGFLNVGQSQFDPNGAINAGLHGYIAEIILADSVLSDAIMNALVVYLAARYGQA